VLHVLNLSFEARKIEEEAARVTGGADSSTPNATKTKTAGGQGKNESEIGVT
jgi:hypothetical protein